ncbi:MAG: hypothetical protein CVU52_11005 [Deltaproteobacteria bacterium HGW-Deltaproteobacteria-10]|jgi:hypothetical protein|nr:MAG: hypothetical protein CVU62_00475 [Deltaproteobacteria bacterium HGW-Deltaproteobacteria-2]PKN65682.1 MAG: hypothetical protein CVU52_11005 [Deltaproteobacteria bacterium HGW-Deltaproteobacteria-10]
MTQPEKRSLATLEPLFFGLVMRVLCGIGCFILIWIIGVDTLTLIGVAALAILGVSLIVGAIVRNPGCEITAIPNLFLSKKKQVHCI